MDPCYPLDHPAALRRAVLRSALGLTVVSTVAVVSGQAAWLLVGLVSPVAIVLGRAAATDAGR